MLAFLAAAVLGPAAALAASGPSAGDNQYTDPLKSTTTTASKPAKTATTTTSTAPASTPPGTINTAPPTATATPTTPIATTAAGTTSQSATLPRTGYDGWLAAALGAGLVAAGLGVRRRVANR